MLLCKISIIVLIFQKIRSVGPVQQKIKSPSFYCQENIEDEIAKMKVILQQEIGLGEIKHQIRF